MRTLRQHLERVRRISRKSYHPIVRKIHKKHNISTKTLFYVKEYGAHSNVPRTIIRESIKILLFASILSSFGGLMLEHIKIAFISLVPLVILMPAMNSMIGGYGSIISSRFSTMLHEGRIKKGWGGNKELRKLLIQVLIISALTACLSALVAIIVSALSGHGMNIALIYNVFFIAVVDSLLLVVIMFFVSVLAGTYFYKKKEDPNNFLIPIATSVADFGNMLILSVLILLLF